MMYLWKTREIALFKSNNRFRRYMEMPKFPIFGIKLNDKEGDFVSKFLSIRPSERWVLVSKDAIFSQQQLWTAWLFSERNFHRENNLARTIDAEFLRYIAGTHHVSEAFRRVGYSDKSDLASIVFLPVSEGRKPTICS